MDKKIFCFLMCSMLFTSCLEHEIPRCPEITNEEIKENVRSIFGMDFDDEHDWCITSSGELTINNIPSNVDKVQLLTYIAESDTTTSLLVLNEE